MNTTTEQIAHADKRLEEARVLLGRAQSVLSQEKAQHEIEIAAADKIVTECHEQYHALQRLLNESELANDSLRAKLAAKGGDKAERLTRELHAAAMGQAAHFQEERDMAVNELAKFKISEALCSDKLEKCRENCAELVDDVKDIRDQLLAAEKRGDNAVTELQRVYKERDELRMTLDDCRTRSNELRVERDGSRKNSKEWFTAHEAMSTKCNDLLVKLEVTLKELDSARRDLNNAQVENEDIRDQLKARDAELAEADTLRQERDILAQRLDASNQRAAALRRSVMGPDSPQTWRKDGRVCRVNDPMRHPGVAPCPNLAVPNFEYCHDHDHLETL